MLSRHVIERPNSCSALIVQAPHEELSVKLAVRIRRRHNGRDVQLPLTRPREKLLEKCVPGLGLLKKVLEAPDHAAYAEGETTLLPLLVVLAKDVPDRERRDILLHGVDEVIILRRVEVAVVELISQKSDGVRVLGSNFVLGCEVGGVEENRRETELDERIVLRRGIVIVVSPPRQLLPRWLALVYYQAHAAATWLDDPRLGVLVHDSLVDVMVHAACDLAGESLERPREGIVVDEHPAGVLGWQVRQVRQVREGEEMVGGQACVSQNSRHFRAEREICPGEIRYGDVQGVRDGVGADEGIDDGRA